jgi:RNA polymerase sigma-70 factor (ECF subfamily)
LRNAVNALNRKKRGGGLRRVRLSRLGRESSSVGSSERLLDSADTPAAAMALREAVLAAQSAVQALPSDQRQAVELRLVQGKSVEEAAASMQRSPGAVRGLVRRAQQALRQVLGRSSRWFSRR